MKAWSLNFIGNFTYVEAAEPVAKENEVIVKVSAAGICGSDIPRTFQNGAHKMPLILGHEFSGQVVKTGGQVDEKWLGKRVGVFPLIPCKKCSSCMKKQYEMCKSYSYLGSRQNGGFAEYVAVPEWNLIELPDSVSFESAAMLEPMAVAVHAMNKADYKEDSEVVVWGGGTIGLFLTMFLLDAGVKNVFLLANHDYQKDYAAEIGLKEENFCNITKEDYAEWLKGITAGQGPDIIYECVGKGEIVEQAIELICPGGEIVVVGNPYGDLLLPKNTYWNILRKQIRLSGTWNSSFLGLDDKDADKDSWHYVIERLSAGKIRPERLISHRLDKEELFEGLLLMKEKKEPYIKVMSLWN